MTAVDAPTVEQAELDQPTPEQAENTRRWVFTGGPHGPENAAIRVLADDEIRAALRALDTLTRLSAGHQWVEHPGSTWRACTCGVLGCKVPDALGAT